MKIHGGEFCVKKRCRLWMEIWFGARRKIYEIF